MAGLLWTALFGLAQAQSGGNRDLAQTMRSVVRVSLIWRDDQGRLHPHSFGSGFIAAPGMVVTNWHVVGPADGRSDMMVWITPHQGFGDGPVLGRIVRFYSAADLALVEAPNLKAPVATIAAEPPGQMENVHAMGYPGLVCRLLACTADEMVEPTTPDFSSGVISRFANRTPEGGAVRTIFHRAATSGGNSGGPIVDDCGRVAGVSTWASGAYITPRGIEAPASMSVATHPQAVVELLQDSDVRYRLDHEPCVLEARIAPDIQRRIDDLQATIEAAENARREADARAEQAAAEAEKDSRRLWFTVLAVGSALVIVATFLYLRRSRVPFRRRKKRNSSPGRLEVGNRFQYRDWLHHLQSRKALLLGVLGVLIGALFILSWWAGAGWAPPGNALNRNLASRDRGAPSSAGPSHLRCVLDAEFSHGHPTGTDSTEIQFDTAAACVAGRTPYASANGQFERYIVSDTEPRVTINRISEDLRQFSQSTYFMSDSGWRRSRNAADALGPIRCGNSVEEVRRIGQRLNALGETLRHELPRRPAQESVWRCSESG